jgi:phosphate transport system permease protein
MLAVMMIPIMVSLSEDAMNSVPRELKEAAYALGVTRWETIKGVIMPAALSGIVAAIILSIGRAVGETMTVLMATGNTPLVTFNMLSSVETMTATIAIEMGEVPFGSLHYSALFAIGATLFIITFVINSIADRLMARFAEVYR